MDFLTKHLDEIIPNIKKNIANTTIQFFRQTFEIEKESSKSQVILEQKYNLCFAVRGDKKLLVFLTFNERTLKSIFPFAFDSADFQVDFEEEFAKMIMLRFINEMSKGIFDVSDDDESYWFWQNSVSTPAFINRDTIIDKPFETFTLLNQTIGAELNFGYHIG